MSAGSAPEGAEESLLERLGHRFSDRSLFDLAITHRSFANEQGLGDHNERLEFLGDAVLGLVVVDRLYRRRPEQAEGELARAKAALVSASALAPYAEATGLGEVLRLGVGESRSGGRRKRSLLADGWEALLGAVYLDGGMAAAEAAVDRYLAWAERRIEVELRDPKTELQERVQARGRPLPGYAIVEEHGPEHDKTFVCRVDAGDGITGVGRGRTRKEAQQAAAAAALAALSEREAIVEPPDGC